LNLKKLFSLRLLRNKKATQRDVWLLWEDNKLIELEWRRILVLNP
jgi:hypothetical protein